ncbi:MAG: peptidylprolyl isomerase [Sphingopyxis sp.]
MSPSEVVANATAGDWVAIDAGDLLVMELTPDAAGRGRRVIIQLIPPPFAQGWVGNIRTLAAAHWWDGLSINRVQDNYVVQWGDADGEDAARARALPSGLTAVPQGDYEIDARALSSAADPYSAAPATFSSGGSDPYGRSEFFSGWPVASTFVGSGLRARNSAWPVHCYGMVGVGRGLSPDTGTGAELYTVIGHAPRHLDRNIALVGRVVEGIQHLSSLPRGTGPLGFYESAEERVTIVSVRLGSELAEAEQPQFQYLNTNSGSFFRYSDARANRRDPFFIVPAGGADICNIPVPVRRVP